MLDFAGPCTTCLKLINSFIVHCVFCFKWIYMCPRVGKTNVCLKERYKSKFEMGRKQGGRNLQEVLEPFVTSQRTTILKNRKW